jgi:hypothetical protein
LPALIVTRHCSARSCSARSAERCDSIHGASASVQRVHRRLDIHPRGARKAHRHRARAGVDRRLAGGESRRLQGAAQLAQDGIEAAVGLRRGLVRPQGANQLVAMDGLVAAQGQVDEGDPALPSRKGALADEPVAVLDGHAPGEVDSRRRQGSKVLPSPAQAGRKAWRLS